MSSNTQRFASCIIQNDKSEILLLHRAIPQAIRWEIPGGRIKGLASPGPAAAKGIKQQLGVEITITRRIGEASIVEDNQQYHYFWLQAKIVRGTLNINDSDFSEYKYFSLPKLQRLYAKLSLNTKNFVTALESQHIKLK